MIYYKSQREVELMRKAGKIVAETLELIRNSIRVDVTTAELDRLANEYILSKNAEPAFLGYRGFPASICASINEEVVHGIPGPRKLHEGDIISIDVGAIYENYVGDAAATFPVGKISPVAEKLIYVTRTALETAINNIRPEKRLLEISRIIQDYVEKSGFSVVRQYVGHGIGTKMHEDPQVPNFVPPVNERKDVVLKRGIVLAIEPMVNEGTYDVEVTGNKWTVVTRDGKLSAHFENTIAVTENGCEILTRL